MKKLTLLVVAISLFCSLSFADTPGFELGFGEIGLGANIYNAKGEREAQMGLNWGLGITYKRYFAPVKYNAWNGYWHAGTLILILPYVGIGADYVFNENVTIGVDTWYIFPAVHVDFSF